MNKLYLKSIIVISIVICSEFLYSQQITYQTQVDPATRTLDTGLPVGTTNGAYSITEQTGAANYSVPIAIPPGTMGMQPSITISYNSQSGNGLLGYGWNLSGLSSITRVGQDLYNEGKVKGVDFSGDDKFALDGNRLVLKSGTYGVIGSVYYTQNETFSQISFKNDLNGKSYFEVLTKDGEILNYGITKDNLGGSRIEMGGTTGPVLAWMLSEVSDRSGNYMRYYYHKDYSKNEFWIEKIEYTGNTNTGSAPYNSISFYYETRTDINNIYIAGYKLQNDAILRIIKTFSESGLVKTYNLEYTKDVNNLYSVLNEIKETGSDGSTFNSIAIGQGNAGAGFEPSEITGIDPIFNDFFSGDFNGDGYSDILAATFYYDLHGIKYHSGYKLYLNNKNGSYSQTVQEAFPSSMCFKIVGGKKNKNSLSYTCGDYNGDGMSDFIVAQTHWDGSYTRLDKIHLYLSLGTSFATDPDLPTFIPYSDYNILWPYNQEVFLTLGDYDGDGATDFITILSNSVTYKAFMYSPKHYCGVYQVSPYLININSSYNLTGDDVLPIDYNGDGKNDLMIVSNCTTNIFTFSTPTEPTNPSGFDPTSYPITSTILCSAGFPTKYHTFYPGDFNGDGKTDFLINEGPQSSIWDIASSNGNSGFILNSFNFNESIFVDANHNIKVGAYNAIIKVGDYNGDAKTDIFLAYDDATTTKIRMYYCNGSSFVNSSYTFNQNIGLDPNYPSHVPVSGDYNGDGKLDELHLISIYDPIYTFSFDQNGQELLTTKIADGLNFKTNINYKLLTDNSNPSDPFYKKTPTSVGENVVLCIQHPFVAVSSVTTDNGLGGIFTTSYKYEGLRIHYKGLGLLGFLKFTQTKFTQDAIVLGTDILTFNYNNLLPDYCNVYLWKKESLNASGNPISTTIYTNNVKDFGSYHRIFPYTSFEQTQNSITGIHTTTSYTYAENEGNITKIETNIIGASTTARKTETYSNYISAGNGGIVKNKYQNKNITNTRGTSIISRAYTYTWDLNKGILLSEKDADYNVLTSYLPDANYGVITRIITLANSQSRIVYMGYDAKKRFVTKITNPLGHINEALYEPKFGNKIWSKDENGLITTNTFDGFGRIKETTLPTGKKITTTINWANGQGPANSLYYTKTEGNGSPYVMEYKDILGRSLRKQTQGYPNLVIYSDNIYNTKGQLWKTSYLDPTGAIKWTEYIYNDPYGFNRLTSIISPVATKTYSYTTPVSSGTSVTETNTSVTPNQWKTTTTDLTGLVSQVEDPGGIIKYTYNGLEQPLTITSNGLATTIIYDAWGRQMYLTDPNAGQTRYEYYSNGELKTQTDAKGNVYTMTYDKLGRVLTKTCPTDATYTYTYDTETNGKGKIALIAATGSNTNSSQQFKYDALGRNYQFTEAISGTNFTTNYSFDDFGNITKITYPGGYSVTNTYDNIGNLIQVNQTSDNKSIWRLINKDYMQHISLSKTANNTILNTYDYYPVSGYLKEIKSGAISKTIFDYSFTFDPATGNLTQRQDKTRAQKVETFTYDNLNRLLTTSFFHGGSSTNYLPNGNIDFKSDVLAVNNHYAYSSTHPNAIEKIENSVGNISSLIQTTDYNAFNKISHIGEETNTSDLYFSYGVDQQRKKMETKINNSLTSTKYYTAGFEREIAGSVTTDWNYISGGDGLAAIYHVVNGTGTLYWVAKDHLGSIMGLYNQSGVMVEEFSYDAWGRRRKPTNWSYSGITLPALITRGYTGHEHLDKFAIINMNGRLYDPVLGRMFSPDIYVQNASSTQSLNRYTYCNNNPLKYTDPDGNNPMVVGFLISAVMNRLFNNTSVMSSAQQVGLVAGMAVGSYVGTALTAANLVGGFLGGSIIGGASAGAGSFASNAVTSWSNGVSFSNGIGAGFNDLWKNTLKGAGIGGVGGAIKALDSRSIIKHMDQSTICDAQPMQGEEYVEQFAKDNLNLYEGKIGVKEITIAPPFGYNYDPSGSYFVSSTGNADGLTYPSWWNGKTTICIANGTTVSKAYLEAVLRHEATHAFHYWRGFSNLFSKSDFEMFTENSAYSGGLSWANKLPTSCNAFKQYEINLSNKMLKVYNLSNPRFWSPTFPLLNYP